MLESVARSRPGFTPMLRNKQKELFYKQVACLSVCNVDKHKVEGVHFVVWTKSGGRKVLVFGCPHFTSQVIQFHCECSLENRYLSCVIPLYPSTNKCFLFRTGSTNWRCGHSQISDARVRRKRCRWQRRRRYGWLDYQVQVFNKTIFFLMKFISWTRPLTLSNVLYIFDFR